MKINQIFLAIFTLLIFTISPAYAVDREDLGDTLDEWVEHAEDMGHDVILSDTYAFDDYGSFTVNLQPGTYHVYAQGDDDISDMNMSVHDSRGRALDSDDYSDNFPVLEFALTSRQDVEFSFHSDDNTNNRDRRDNGRNNRYGRNNRDEYGYFAFVLAKETSNSRYSRSDSRDDYDYNYYSDYRRNDDDDDDYYYDYDDDDDWNDYDDSDDRNRNNNRSTRDLDQRLEDLIEYAQDRNMDVVYQDTEDITDTRTFSLNLPRGHYVIFASGGVNIEDLDIRVLDADGDEIAEDTQVNNDPNLWFDLNRQQRVTVEIEVFEFAQWDDEGEYIVVVAGN